MKVSKLFVWVARYPQKRAQTFSRSQKYDTFHRKDNGKDLGRIDQKLASPQRELEACHQLLSVGCYSALMFDKNSPFALVLLSLSISNSIASTGDSGFSTLRSTQIRDRSSRGISNSSLRVPDR